MEEEISGSPSRAPVRHQKRWRAIMIVIAACVLVLGGGVALFLVMHGRSSRLPDRIRQEASFPLYFPQPLPDGFTADMKDATYDSVANLMHITLADANGRTVTLNEQPMPNNFSLNDLAVEGSPLNGILGQGVISTVEGGTVASIVSTDKKTLILLNTTTATKDELTHLAQALRPSR